MTLPPSLSWSISTDLVEEMLDALEGKEHHCTFSGLDTVAQTDGRYCCVPTSHKATLGEIVDLLEAFKAQPQTLLMPEIPAGSFAKKLYSTYLSYLPKEKVTFPLKMNVDERGSFYRAAQNSQLRPGVNQYFQARDHQGAALA